MKTERLTLTVSEAAKLLGIGRNLAYDLVSRGELPSIRFGRRILVPRAQLDAKLAGTWVPPLAPGNTGLN